jgi:hypothetical protein
MRRIAFLFPAAVSAIAVSILAVALDLGETPTYALIGVVGFFLLLGSALQDLGIPTKRGKVVEMHQAAVGAEEWDGSVAGPSGFGAPDWDEDRSFADEPMRMPARRAGIYALRFQKREKRGELIGFCHLADPMPK